MKNNILKQLLIIAGAALLFIPFLGQVHLFDWDEVNFAECAREMIVSDNYLRVQIDFQPFWEKPPLFIWMQAFCMRLFGISEFSARLPNAVIGIITLSFLFYVGKKVANERMAWWWVLIYTASWLPHFYFKTAIIDPTFNLLIFLAFFQVYLLRHQHRKWFHAALAGIFLGLAVLTKGPVAILVALLSLIVYLIWNRGFQGYKWYYFALIVLFAVFTTSLWFGIDVIQNGWWFTKEFITYQIRLFRTEDAGHGGPFYYHFLVLLVGCFPASVFLFQYSRKNSLSEGLITTDFSRWMWVLLWIVLILFSVVKTKIVHYSSLCYFPISYLAALQINRINRKEVPLKRGVVILLAGIGSLVAVAITLLPVIGLNKEKLIPYIDDEFAVANLQAAVNWHYAECLLGLTYLIGILFSLILLRKSFHKGVLLLCCVQILIIQVCMIHFVPKIEAYTQKAAVDFYKSFAGKDVYLQPLGFVSYGYLFYSDKQPSVAPQYYKDKINFLLHDDVDKPVYFITKSTSAAEWEAHENLVKVGSANGYTFFKRK